MPKMKRKEKNKNKSYKKYFKDKLKNITKENIKAYFLLFLKTTKEVLLDNKYVVIYFIGAVLNGIILRWISINKPFAIRPIMADLVISLLFVSIYFFIRKKYRFMPYVVSFLPANFNQICPFELDNLRAWCIKHF
ncbi:hypothetical protein IJJ27_01170 [bacterium]|nr:hypothetical protein [bacterium]